jgi:F-type H+-transporting ATPase subunit delta
MQSVDEVGVAIAGVYARALLDIADKSGAADSVREELDGLVALANRDSAFAHFLESTVIDVDQRRASLEKMFRGRLSDLVLDTLQVLNRKDRLMLLEEVARQYVLALEESRNEVEITVTTAKPLDESSRTELMEALKRHTGAGPVVTEEVDENLIGGMIVRVGDEKIDFSVATKLRRLHQLLLERASHEIHSGRHYYEGA